MTAKFYVSTFGFKASAFGFEYDFPERPAATSQREVVMRLFGKGKGARSEKGSL